MFAVADKSLIAALLVSGNGNKTGCSDYSAGPHEFLQHLRGAALEAIVLCEVVDIALEVYSFASSGVHVPFQSLAVPTIVKGDGKDDLPCRELDTDYRNRERVLQPDQEIEDIVLGDDLGIEMILEMQFGDVADERDVIKGPYPWLI